MIDIGVRLFGGSSPVTGKSESTWLEKRAIRRSGLLTALPRNPQLSPVFNHCAPEESRGDAGGQTADFGGG